AALTPRRLQDEINIPIESRRFQAGEPMINKSLIAALICALPFASTSAKAADIKILCASGMREVVSELQPRLGRIVGQQVTISFGEAGDLRKRMQGGEIASIRWRRAVTPLRE